MPSVFFLANGVVNSQGQEVFLPPGEGLKDQIFKLGAVWGLFRRVLVVLTVADKCHSWTRNLIWLMTHLPSLANCANNRGGLLITITVFLTNLVAFLELPERLGLGSIQ